MSAAPKQPQAHTDGERITALEVMLGAVSEGIQALNRKLDNVLLAIEARASKEWVEKLERRLEAQAQESKAALAERDKVLQALRDEVRSRPTYLAAGAWSAVLGLLALLAGKYLLN